MAEKKLTVEQIAMAQFWRDDALEAAALIVERYANPNSVDMALDIRAMKSIALQALAQPEARWIQVSERLPDEHEACEWMPLSGYVFSGHYEAEHFYAPGKRYTKNVVRMWRSLSAQPETREGYVLVPVELNAKMLRSAMKRAYGETVYENIDSEALGHQQQYMREIYAAMIRAAQDCAKPPNDQTSG